MDSPSSLRVSARRRARRAAASGVSRAGRGHVACSVRSRAGRARGEVNAFFYNISNFVFLDVTDVIEDGLNVSNYVQGDSRFTGAEAVGHFDLGGGATLHASIAFVNATLTETDEHLPRIPPVQGRVGVDQGGVHESD